MLVSSVQPVAILSAVFCTVCMACMFVLDAMDDQTVLAYSRTGSVMALYVVVSVSLLFPHCVEVSALSMFSVFLALLVLFCVCLLYVSLGSSVSPSMVGSRVVGSVVLFICRFSVVEYSAGSGVKRVVVVLEGFSCNSFSMVQLCIVSR